MYRLAIASGSRADYGLLRPLINTLGHSGHFDIDLFVTGSHLSDDHGLTKNEICTDHLDNIHEIPCALGATVDVAVSVAQILTGVSQVLKSCKAKSIIILGDRFEAFAFAQASPNNYPHMGYRRHDLAPRSSQPLHRGNNDRE